MRDHEVLDDVRKYAAHFLAGLGDRPVGWTATVDELRAALGGALPEDGGDVRDVIAGLIDSAEPGTVGTTSPRYFGFVIGGTTPAALAADWLTSLWDQNAGLYVAGPAASVAEEVAGRWLIELLGLPPDTSCGFVTGATMANFTALAAARHHVLAARDWDVNVRGLQGSPKIRVVVGEERHVTVDIALRYLGFGTENLVVVPCDEQGRMSFDGLVDRLGDGDEPTIVCTQAGNVNTGSFDPIDRICDVSHELGAWVHVDGAFGLWAAVSPDLRRLIPHHDKADSWATDGHKWLNVPYDSGFVFCAHPESHRAAMSVRAGYLIHAATDERDEMDWGPEFSRRARGFPVYATIRSLGRAGIVEMIERCCRGARRFADRFREADGVEVVNDVVLNQVLVRFTGRDGSDDGRTARIVERVQRDGTCWLSGSTWQGMSVMRISVTNWQTTEHDVDRSVKAILEAAEAETV